ncbi:hypothetical protein OPW36_06435 [Vibrio europaeus]|uniref:Lipoprotein n=1 Tax=Vibrio europaeus TaxID=300876 RepID=A0AAE7AVL4_9VIBR|nr:hypothetical protein [Vibrio europaeus]MDC5804325.1 hypothetical protein [Vibrio europaeus]MDC5808427.1 hypothetical protein [Vibrio europaeus]MDC5824359.1 hypothetical protein [Vibrio europaeus]MDC5829781.1 hypothetical protein [Vibrio europaeus]MDC5833677.1 hypothetical protein [Vibrio europaeus]
MLSKKVILSIGLVVVVSGCAEMKEAGTAIGHATRDTTTAIGHATRDTTKAIGHASRDAVKSVKEDLSSED